MTTQKDVAATPLQPIVMASVPELALPKPYYEKDHVVIYNASFERIMPFITVVDCVLTDPPYGVEFAKWDAESCAWAVPFRSR